jgi:hypothetical protein
MGKRFILTRTLPRSLVVCLATESLANKTSNFLAHFLILVLSLLKALRPSTSISRVEFQLIWATHIKLEEENNGGIVEGWNNQVFE